MVYNASAGQYYQVGLVTGGVSNCGNTDIPDYYARLDHPEISGFLTKPEDFVKSGLNKQLNVQSEFPARIGNFFGSLNFYYDCNFDKKFLCLYFFQHYW